jgi:zinc protease
MSSPSPTVLPTRRVSALQKALESLNEEASATAKVEHVETIPFGPVHTVERFLYGNGLMLLALRDKSAPVLSYHTWFRVGSRHEKPGKTGLAHLFEHLMFNETKTLPAGMFDRKLEEAGAESNAATWVDWTFYHENVPKDRLALVVNLESSRMSELVLRDPQVTSEKEVVSNERRMRVDDDIDGSVSELLYKTIFRKHAYGWPTIGWMDDIQSFTTSDCDDFYHTYYAPNNAIIVVVGDFEYKELVKKIQNAYGQLPSSQLPLEDVHPEPPQQEERRVEVSKPTMTEKLSIGYRGPALGDTDHLGLTVFNEALTGGRSSRAYRALVQEQELSVDIRGWVSSFRDPGVYELSSTCRPNVSGEQVLTALEQVIQPMLETGLGEEELEKCKARLELAALQGLETCGGKAEQIGFWEALFGDPSLPFRRVDAVRRLTNNDVIRAARRYLVPEARTLMFVRPTREGEPEPTEDLQGIGSTTLIPKTLVSGGEQSDAQDPIASSMTDGDVNSEN